MEILSRLRVRGGCCEVRALTEDDVCLALEALEGTLAGDLLPEDYVKRRPSVSVWWRGELLAWLGLFLRWPGVAIPWAMVTPEGRAHPVMLHRTARRLLEAHLRTEPLHWLELELLDGVDAARDARWLEALGFTREHVKAAGGPHREPVTCWARLP